MRVMDSKYLNRNVKHANTNAFNKFHHHKIENRFV